MASRSRNGESMSHFELCAMHYSTLFFLNVDFCLIIYIVLQALMEESDVTLNFGEEDDLENKNKRLK